MRVTFDLPNPNRFSPKNEASRVEIVTEDYFKAVAVVIFEPDESVQPEGFRDTRIFLPKPLARAVASAMMGAAAEL